MEITKDINTALIIGSRYAEQTANMKAASRAVSTARMYAFDNAFTEDELKTLHDAEILLERAEKKYNFHEAAEYLKNLKTA